MTQPVLVINCGSSGIKASLIQEDKTLTHASLDFAREAMLALLEKMPKKNLLGIGHRFVHGGSKYVQSVQLNEQVISDLETLTEFAPLHNESALIAIKTCFEYFGTDVPEVAVFDTAFFSQMPNVSSHYALPQGYGIRRFGFHGISHHFLWDTLKKEIGKADAKVITLHLGAGCSCTAIDSGQAVDTSMGFTPAEGLMMATRAGDIDCAVVEYLCDTQGKSPHEIMDLLNFQSGLLGLSGISADMKEVLEHYEKNESAKLAVDLFCYRIVKYLGAYIASLGGLDAIIFSAGIGENAPKIRQMIIQKMAWYGIELDSEVNEKVCGLAPGSCQKISSATSQVVVYVIATDENLFIAKSVRSILLGPVL